MIALMTAALGGSIHDFGLSELRFEFLGERQIAVSLSKRGIAVGSSFTGPLI